MLQLARETPSFSFLDLVPFFMLLSDMERGVLITCVHTGTWALSFSLSHMRIQPMSGRTTDSSVEKVRASKIRLKYVLTALTLTAYIESIHRDSDRPVTSVSCNWWDNVKTFKICKLLLQRDCAVDDDSTEERETSLFIQTDFHDMCSAVFSCVSSLDCFGARGLNPQEWIQPHEAARALWGCMSWCLCLHAGSIHVNHMRYLLKDSSQGGEHTMRYLELINYQHRCLIFNLWDTWSNAHLLIFWWYLTL